MTKNIAVVSLGCDKNRVDTERMLFNLIRGGHRITDDYAQAQIIIVNTCAFIEAARVEALDTVLSMAEYKKDSCEKLIVTGCLPQKYAAQIKNDLYEVDKFLGVNEYDDICLIIDNLYCNANSTHDAPLIKENYGFNRTLTTPPHYAFLKIAEGCDNHCTFCTIPSIRGNYRSFKIESLIAEAQTLIDNGAKEIILIAQDVTRYGTDLYGKLMLTELIRELTRLDLMYVRLMYCYPELVTDELINEIDSNPKVAKYIDIPLQHVNDGILKLMNRRSRNADIKKLIGKIRSVKNYIAVRTTFMVGFPSETDEQFNELRDFVAEYKLDNVGIFAYSAESDTPSAKIKGRVSKKVKLERVKQLGETHLKNTLEYNRLMLGKTVKVIYEDIDYDKNLFKGRTEYNAPEIDTFVYFKADFADIGEVYDIKITGIDGYDLTGEKI